MRGETDNGSQSKRNLGKVLQLLGEYHIIPQLDHRARDKLATTSVSPWCAVDSARAAGECVTQLPLKLKIGDSGSWMFYRLDPESGRAVQIGPPYQGGVRKGHSCTAIGSQIFVVGGVDSDNKALDSVEVYDYCTDLWSTMAPMSTARQAHCCTAIGSKLFVVGGMDSNYQALDFVEVYDYCIGSWSTMAPMSNARVGHSCTLIGSKIFVVGGKDSNRKTLDSVEVYDYCTDSWIILTPISTAIGSQIFVVGGVGSGYQAIDSVEVYDCSTDLWSTMAPMVRKSIGSYGILCEVTEQPTTSPIITMLHDRFE